MRIAVEWSIEVTENYSAEIDLPDALAERLSAMVARGIGVHDALILIEDEDVDLGSAGFELGTLLGLHERDETQTDAAVIGRTIESPARIVSR